MATPPIWLIYIIYMSHGWPWFWFQPSFYLLKKETSSFFMLNEPTESIRILYINTCPIFHICSTDFVIFVVHIFSTCSRYFPNLSMFFHIISKCFHVLFQTCSHFSTWLKNMGVSENNVPLNPLVNDHYPYQMAIIGNIPNMFRQTHIFPHVFRNFLGHRLGFSNASPFRPCVGTSALVVAEAMPT